MTGFGYATLYPPPPYTSLSDALALSPILSYTVLTGCCRSRVHRKEKPMRIEYVKTVTYTCPVCNTSIKFDVEPDWNSMKELFDAVDNLTCPKCKEDLSYQAKLSLTRQKTITMLLKSFFL